MIVICLFNLDIIHVQIQIQIFKDNYKYKYKYKGQNILQIWLTVSKYLWEIYARGWENFWDGVGEGKGFRWGFEFFLENFCGFMLGQGLVKAQIAMFNKRKALIVLSSKSDQQSVFGRDWK